MAKATKGRPQACDLLIRNAHVLTMDKKRTIVPVGAIAVTGRDIVAVGRDSDLAKRFRPHRVIDAGSAPVHPGYTDLHYHATVHIISKLIADAPAGSRDAGPWVAQRYERFHNVADDEDDYAAALLCGLEMVLNGFTAVMDPGTAFVPDILAEAMTAVGMRATVSDPYLMDFKGPQLSNIKRTPVSKKRAFGQLGKQLWRNRDPNALVRGHVAIYGMGSQTVELTEAAKELADKNKCPFTMHQSMCLDDAEFDERRFGKSAFPFWEERGVLGPNCVFVHMNVLRDDDIRPIVKSGMTTVWVPGNSLFYGTRSEVPNRIPEIYRKGGNVAFGIDVCKTWTFGHNTLLAYYIGREEGHYLSAGDLLEMQTIRGARAMGLEKQIGSLEAGKRADIVIRTNSAPQLHPIFEIEKRVALQSLTGSVDTVIVDGRMVVRHGRHTMLDEAVVYDRAKRSAANLLRKADF